MNGAVVHGLAIMQRYMTLLGGQIEVRSRLGEGATFTVRPYP